jgi:hypothetical protein
MKMATFIELREEQYAHRIPSLMDTMGKCNEQKPQEPERREESLRYSRK